MVKLFFECYDEIEAYIRENSDPKQIIQILEAVSGVMFAVQPYVVKRSFWHKNI